MSGLPDHYRRAAVLADLPPVDPAAPAQPRTLLLTGASGVVGRAILARLRLAYPHWSVVCLVHRTPVSGPGVHTVHGDLGDANLGLAPDAYGALADRVDAVLHCGAVTDFNRDDGSLERANIDGTGHMLAFASRAHAPMYHVSTAFLEARAQGDRGSTSVRYASSKRAGEQLVRDSGVPHVIVRPSVVIGDTQTGQIADFQGMYRVAGALLRGLVPLIPFDPSWPLDLIPADVVADATLRLIDARVTSGEFWLTAGKRCLTLQEAVETVVAYGAQVGVPVDVPRFVPPEMFDRLIGPVFLDALPDKVRTTVVRLLEFFTAYLARDEPMPSSLDELAALGLPEMPDSRECLLRSLQYWGRQYGLGTGGAEGGDGAATAAETTGDSVDDEAAA